MSDKAEQVKSTRPRISFEQGVLAATSEVAAGAIAARFPGAIFVKMIEEHAGFAVYGEHGKLGELSFADAIGLPPVEVVR